MPNDENPLGFDRSQLRTQTVTPRAPTKGNVLVFQGGSDTGWGDQPPAALSGGAIGLAITYMPTPAPTPDSGNCYHSEATFRAALAAVLLATCGPIWVAVDSSLATANLTATALPGAGRTFMTSARDLRTGTGDILNILDGASLQDFGGVIGGLQISCTCATAPALTFTGGVNFLVRSARINNNGAAALCNIAGGVAQFLIYEQGVIAQNGAGTLFALAGAAFLFTANDSSAGLTGAGVVTGGVGTSWLEDRGANGNLPTAPGFAGTHTIVPLAHARWVQFDAPALQPAQAAAIGPVTAQYAIQMKLSLVWNIGANYVLDAGAGPPGQADHTIQCGIANLNITLPLAAANPGREFVFIDASGGVGGNAFNIVPQAVDQVGPLAVNTTRTVTQVEARAVTIKSMAPASPNTWQIITSTLLA